MVPALTARGADGRGARPPLRRGLRAERHGDGELPAGHRGRVVRADARRCRRWRRSGSQTTVLSGLNCMPVARPPGRRARQGVHALPHRHLAAHERNLARRRHLDRSDPGQRARQGRRSWRRSSWRSRTATPPAPATSASPAPTPTRSRGGAPTRRCRCSTTRARCSSGCSATPAAPTRGARLARIRQQRSVLDSVRQEIAGLSGALGPSDRGKLTEYLDSVRDVERRIERAESQSGRELPVLDRPGGRAGQLRGARQADVRPRGAGLSARSDARHHASCWGASSAA